MNELLSALTLWLADYLVVATALLAAAALAWRLIRQPAQRMALAWGTMVGLTVLAIATALPNWPRVNVQRWAVSLSPAEDEPVPKPVVKIEERVIPVAGDSALPTSEPPALLPTSAAEPIPHRLAGGGGEQAIWPMWLTLAWLALAAVALVWIALGAVQACRLLWTARQSPLWVQSELARLVGRRRKPRLKTSPHIGSAVALGALKPAILLPADHVHEDNRAGIQAALAHEWAHIRHGDLWLLAWQRLLLPLLAAHPLFWLLRRQIRADQEVLADLAAAGEKPVEYAEALLAWAKEAGPRPSAGLAALAMWENPQTVSRRIQMVLDPKSALARQGSRVWQWLIVLALAAIGGGLSLVSFRSQPAVAQEAEAASQGSPAVPRGRLLPPTAQMEQVELAVIMVRLGKEGEKASQESIRSIARHFGEEIQFDSGVCVVALPRQQVESALKALRDEGQAKVLSQPKLMTTSGRDAYFADGGDLPSIRETDYGDRRVEMVEYHSLRSLRIRPEVRTLRAAGAAGSHRERPAVVRLSVTRENAEPIENSDLNKDTGATRPQIIKRQLTFAADVPVGRTLLVWELKPPAADEANLVLITPAAIHRVTREVFAHPPEPVAQDSIDPKTDPRRIPEVPNPAQLQDSEHRQIQLALEKLDQWARSNPTAADWVKENARLQQQVADLTTQLAYLRSLASQESKDKVTDDIFARRVYLDLLGMVPTPEDVKAFVESQEPHKRQALLDKLLADAKVADHWTKTWKEAIAPAKPLLAEAKPDAALPSAAETPSVAVFRLQHAAANDAAQVLGDLLRNRNSSARVVADARTNSLIIEGLPPEMKWAEILKLIDPPAAPPSAERRHVPDAAADGIAAYSPQTQRKLLEIDLQQAEAEMELAAAELEEAKKLGDAVSGSELRKKEAALLHARLKRQRAMILLEAAAEREKPAAQPSLDSIAEDMVPPKNLPERIWQSLGLKLQPADAAELQKLKSTFRGGLTVAEVRPGSPADDRGIVKDDILVGLDRWETRSLENVAYVLEHEDIQEVGETSFHIVRGGKVLVGRMPLGREPAAAAGAADPNAADDPQTRLRLAEIDLREAMIKLEAATRDHTRIAELAKQSSVPQSEVDRIALERQHAELAVERARVVLEGLKSQQTAPSTR